MNNLSDHPLVGLIEAACRAGADEAEAVMSRAQNLSVGVRQGILENVERAEPAYYGLRVWVGERSASLSSADLAVSGKCGALIERALAIARAAPKNPFGGLAPAPAAADDEAALQLFDPATPGADQLVERAREVESAALAISGISNSGGAMASLSTSERFHATSRGFAGHRRRSSFGLGVSVVAGLGAAKQTDFYGSSATWRRDVQDASEIGAEAGRRAAARLAPRRLISMRAPVIFERRIALDLLGPFISAISGPNVVRGSSFLRHRLGQAVFAPGIDVSDDPAVPRGLGSRAVDDEGVACTPRPLVEHGVLTSWLLNVASAAQLGLQPNGYAGRGAVGASGICVSNLRVAPGTEDLPALMAQAQSGLMVTGMFNPSLNPNTGEWSAGVHGIWFDAGEPAFPVSEITVAGSLPEFYARLIAGADVAKLGAAITPSLMVDAVAIGGL